MEYFHPTDLPMTRRRMMKASGYTVGAATVGVGGKQLGISPVQDSEALGITTAIVGGSVLAGAGLAGAAIHKHFGSGDGDPEGIKDTAVENAVHDVAATMDGQREAETREMIRDRWINRPNNQTPFADVSWSELEVAAAHKIINGDNSGALSAAYETVDKQHTIASYNALNSYMSAFVGSDSRDGLITSLVMSFSRGTGQVSATGLTNTVTWDNGSVQTQENGIDPCAPADLGKEPDYYNFDSMPRSYPDWSPVKSSEVLSDWDSTAEEQTASGTGEYCLFKREVSSFKKAPGNIASEELSTPVELIGIPIKVTYQGYTSDDRSSWYLWHPQGAVLPSPSISGGQMQATHSSRTTAYPLEMSLFDSYFGSIDTSYTNMTDGDIDTYVNTLDNALAEGIKDPADIFGPRHIVNEFSNASNQKRVASQVVGQGMGMPSEEISYQAEVSHPNIQSSSKWGTLFIDFADGETTNITGGTTLSTTQYEGAILTFPREDNPDKIEQRYLSGSSKLEILSISGAEGSYDVADTQSGKKSDAGDVLVYQGENPPDALANPGDYQNAVVEIKGGQNHDYVPVLDIEQDGNKFWARNTALVDGELIDYVRIVPSVQMTDTAQAVNSPGSISEDKIDSRLNSYSQLFDEIDEMDSSGDLISGGIFDGGLPTLPGLGVIESAAVVGAGIFGINFLSN